VALYSPSNSWIELFLSTNIEKCEIRMRTGMPGENNALKIYGATIRADIQIFHIIDYTE
jgi:hypothetical protein